MLNQGAPLWKKALVTVGLLPVSFVASFFFAGAILFPIINSYYLGRVILSLGIVGLDYGYQSLVTLGTIETCGFLSGNCSTHDVRQYALLLFPVIYVVSLLFFLLPRKPRT